MKKTFFEAQYRITDRVYNQGYICIAGNSIKGIFSFDCVSIEIKNRYIYLYLKEFEPENESYYETVEFVGKYNIETLDSPCTYILKSSSNEILSLQLIRRITNLNSIPDIVKQFDLILGE